MSNPLEFMNPSTLRVLLKCTLLWFCLGSEAAVAQGQGAGLPEEAAVVTTSNNQKTEVSTDANGALRVNVSPKDVQTFKKRGWVKYSDFGAKSDGKSDDIDAIAAAHAFANQQGLPVKADAGATYYIGGKERTVMIRTDTDFGKATFIIDDTEVQNRNAPVFVVSSSLQPFPLKGVSSLKRNQEKIDATLPGPCLITVTNANVKRYIRLGLNQNNGASQTDIFMVDKNGKVDMDAPIIWDFDQITEISALPVDEKTLTITGGRFTTIANREESAYTYYSRNITIKRSNVLIDGLEHRITGEGDHGAPYGGFLGFRDCANVTVRNTLLTGHKTYSTIGNAGKPVSMGTYDLSATRALNLSFIDCRQTNDIDDRTYWGILGSSFCKNMLVRPLRFFAVRRPHGRSQRHHPQLDPGPHGHQRHWQRDFYRGEQYDPGQYPHQSAPRLRQHLAGYLRNPQLHFRAIRRPAPQRFPDRRF